MTVTVTHHDLLVTIITFYHIILSLLSLKTRDKGEKGDREIQVKIEKPFKVVYTILALL